MQFSPLLFAAVLFSSALAAMGLGGGTLLILFLSFFSSLSQPQMQAVNLFLFLPTTALSLYFHHKNGLLDFQAVKKFLPGGIVGCIIGSILSNHIDPSLLQKCFAVFLLIFGTRELISSVRLIFQNFSEHKKSPPA